MSPSPIVDVRGLRLSRGTRVILAGATFSVARGELVAIMGASGSGKTTLLRAIAGLEPFDAGAVIVDAVAIEAGTAATSPRLAPLRRKVGMVFQFHCLFEHLSVLRNVCLAPVYAQGVPPADAESRGMALLGTFGVEHRARAFPRQLSGGEAQRVAIARALAVDPPVLLMDEPTASLDPERRAELGELLKGLVADGRTLLVATHDEPFARAWATRVIRISDGVVAG